MHRQMKNSRPLFRREIGDALQPSDQRVLVASIHAGKSSKARCQYPCREVLKGAQKSAPGNQYRVNALQASF
jgi:hypothetical protein